MTPVVAVEDAVKVFRVAHRAGLVRRRRVDVRALDGVSFAIEEGEVVGYAGPNGAGKSTTVKLLTGILVPSGGRVRVLGLDPSRRRVAVAGRIGVVFGQRSSLWWDLPLVDSFDLLRHVYRVPAGDHRRRRDELVELLELGPFLPTPVRQLSLGQRMRGELAAALLHGPELLLLDEPTIGLDVVSKERVRSFLAERNRRDGTTVLLTTHDLGDIERLCSRLVVVDRGKVVHDGTLEAIRRRWATDRLLVVDLEVPVPPLDVPGATVERVDGARQWLRFSTEVTTAAALVAAVAARAPLRDLTVTDPDIEEVLRRLATGRPPP